MPRVPAQIGPGESGNAEFLVEGRREGTHIVEMAITGTLNGLDDWLTAEAPPAGFIERIDVDAPPAAPEEGAS